MFCLSAVAGFQFHAEFGGGKKEQKSVEFSFSPGTCSLIVLGFFFSFSFSFFDSSSISSLSLDSFNKNVFF